MATSTWSTAKSDVIISGGENVYAREVEEALYRVPRVKDAAVIGVPDERWGEVPLAVLVTSDGGTRHWT